MCAYFGGYARVLMVSKIDGAFDYNVLKHLVRRFSTLTGQPLALRNHFDLVFTHGDVSNDPPLTNAELVEMSEWINKVWHVDAHSKASTENILDGCTRKAHHDYFVEYNFNQNSETGKWSMSYQDIHSPESLIHAVKPKQTNSCAIM